MNKKILSFDLGTGGNKASVYDTEGNCLASAFVPYTTQYPQIGWHEQRPADWWNAVVESTHQLLKTSGIDKNDIVCLGISGHSLGAVPVDKDGNLLRDETPIWSDIRAQKEVDDFFKGVNPDHWYLTTGNGFPAACYTVFKVMWYKNHEPEMWKKVFKILGTKDFINFKLTGKFITDYSYASGTGIYDLKGWKYNDEFIAASGIPAETWPEIVPSTQVLGIVAPEVAKMLGLSPMVQVVCGGVDNSCMALGAKNIRDGRVYTSLGSSAWIAVSAEQPVLDKRYKPFVFAHVMPNMFTSAVSIFSAGTSFSWVKDNLCKDLIEKANKENKDVYVLMNREAEKAPVGSNKLLFNPSLAGGTSQDTSVHIRGAYIGLDLKHGKPELIRAAMEGIAMNLRLRLDLLRKYTRLEDEILFVGGGAKSLFYLGIFADTFNTRILKTNIDQDAGALGAAAIAAVGCGLWKNFDKIDEIHKAVEVVEPNKENNRKYEKLLPVFSLATEYQAKVSDALREIAL
ncbi:MAG: xylulokinase [Chloroflexi bacterium]|nr:MAG: xylulokinase [Chloroflexota bacterium]MBA4376655.1 pentose kinase [Anaerolinea sp.]